MHWNARRRLLSRTLCLALCVSALPTLRPAPASAQDWAADNADARRQEIIRRYREILERRPEQGRIFDLLLQEVGAGAGLERLVDDYRARLEQSPDNFAYAMLLGHLLARTDRYAEARVAYETARDLAPSDPLPWRALGRTYGRLDRRAESEAAWETALSLATDTDSQREILRELADLALAARDWERAGAYFDRLVALEPGNVYVRMELAETLVRFERYEDALAQYRAIADSAGTDTRQRAVATRDIGEVLMLLGRAEEAVATFREAMRLVQPGYWLHRELQLRIVEVYRRDDRLEEYVTELEQTLRSPGFDDLMLLASLYDELGRDDDALEALRRATSRNSSSVDARLALIRVLERRGETDAVIEEYQRLIRGNPSDPSFRFRLVDVLRRSGDRDGAVELLDEMASRFAADVYTLVEVADRYMRFRLPEQAGPIYERLVRLAPDDPNHYIALGDWHFVEGRRSEAERVWRQLADIVRPEHEARATLGQVLADHGLNEEAIAEFELALEAAPDELNYMRSLARLYGDAGRMPQSLRLWERILEQAEPGPARAEARTALVRGLDTLGRLQDRVTEWRETFAADAASREAGYLVAEGSLHLQDEAGAETAWLAVLAVDDADLVALSALERLYTSQNRITDAIDVLLRITEVSPPRAREALHRLAELSLRVFDDEAAVRFATAAVELNPDDASARARLGDVFRQMQRYDDAIAQYREAIDLDPRAFPIYFLLADLYQTTQRPTDARDLYRVVLAESSDEPQILRAGRRVLRIEQAAGTLDDMVPILEARLYDQNVGGAFLKLAVEAFDARTQPILRTAAWGTGDERAAARIELDAIGRRAQRPLLDALAGDDIALRSTALRLLGELRSPGASLAIARLLDLPGATDDERSDALLALALLADPRTVNDLGRVAADPADPTRALLATWALGRIGDDSSVSRLDALAADTGRPAALRAMAVVGLGRAAESHQSSARVAAALVADTSELRHAALAAVAMHGEVEADGPLVMLLQHGQGKDPMVAAWALGFLAPTPSRQHALVDAWLLGGAALGEAALAALERSGGSQLDVAALFEWEERLSFWSAAASTFDVTAYLDGLRASGLLRVAESAIIDPEAVSRALGAALAAAGDQTAEVLLRAARVLDGASAPPSLRQGVAAALAAHADRIDAIAVGGRAPAARTAAIQAFRWIPDASVQLAGTARSAATNDPDAAVRRAAVVALGHLGDATAAPILAEALLSDDWQLRAVAADAIGRIGAIDLLPSLAALAADDAFATVRGAAWRARLRLDEGASCDALVASWESIDAATRLGALADVSTIGQACRGRLLDRAAADPDARLRAIAASTQAP